MINQTHALGRWDRIVANRGYRADVVARVQAARRAQACAESRSAMAERRQRERMAAALARMEAARDAAVLRRLTPRVRRIVARIAGAMRVRPALILGRTRERRAVLARQAVMYWCRRLYGWSYPQTGSRLGGYDHTTVLHGCRAYVAKRAAQGRTLRRAR